jgi:hypothetical protein
VDGAAHVRIARTRRGGLAFAEWRPELAAAPPELTGDMTRPIIAVMPLSDVRVKLKNFGPVTHAYTLVERRELRVERVPDETAQPALPRIREYEVVVFER